MIAIISNWILSIAGVVCLSVVVQLVLPEGQMNRYIKGIFGFIIIFVIISPIPKLVGSKLNLDEVFNGEIVLQDEYLEQLNLNKVMKIKEVLEKDCSAEGYDNVVISVNADIFASNFEIKSVSVDISQIVLTEKAQHRNISEVKNHILSLIQNRIKIEKGEIYFDE